MKTIVLTAALAATAAFALLPLSFEVTVSVLFGAGLFLLAAGDYSRRQRVLPVGQPIARIEKHALAA